ncbi:triose-phosphate isomerase [Galactobacter caseinivorans]|uniref:Triosephosphate isomerase n=1 Tax=Galactobacter caseinivorans TaxID=2676123 RepID=A0A496PKM5_9MICC|nr:triose-phosphate isomerase [Galactobacter caseinivorans]RKW71064.1 triose-phosphate isomerase [Galactobacter caseinivorans]
MATLTNGAFDRRPLIAGNWKMNMDHRQGITLLQKTVWTLQDANHDFDRVEVAVFPPFTDLRGVQTLVAGDDLPVAYGGQDLSPAESGAYTGDISGQFLQALGCTFALVGHSERRTLHSEGDDVALAKVQAALRHELTPILCVGEDLEVRRAGTHVAHTLDQVHAVINELDAATVATLVIAYEPVWAIGTGEVAGPEDAQEMCSAIREAVRAQHGDDAAAGARLLYGGSVKANNVAQIMRERDVDGVLVGGASLDAAEFASIARFEQHLVTDEAR